jgi:hypothetical protein
MFFHHFPVYGNLAGHHPRRAMNGPVDDNAPIPHPVRTVRPMVDALLM